MHKKVRISNSKYKTTKFSFQFVKNFIIATLFSLMSIYFVYLFIQLGFSGVYSIMGVWGILLIICLIFLAIIFWITTIQTFNSVNLDNVLTKIREIRVEDLEFCDEGVLVCENSGKFKIEYSNIKSMEFFINASVISGKYYLNNLKLDITYISGEELKDISIVQEPSFKIFDQIYDILYFAQKCPNFSLKFPNENAFLQTTLGKAISSYLKNNCQHTFSSFMQTSKGMVVLSVVMILSILITIWFQFI